MDKTRFNVDTKWTKYGACRKAPSGTFFPTGPKAKVLRAEREAKAFCAQCPVFDQCRAYADETLEQFGIWAGETPQERRDRRRGVVEAAVRRKALPWRDREPLTLAQQAAQAALREAWR